MRYSVYLNLKDSIRAMFDICETGEEIRELQEDLNLAVLEITEDTLRQVNT